MDFNPREGSKNTWTNKGKGGGGEMSMFLNKSYQVKLSTRGGEGGLKSAKFCPCSF